MKNIKSILTNSISIIIGILIYVFLSQNFFSYSVNIAGAPTTGTQTGYQLIRQLFEGGDSTMTSTCMVVSLFIISILAGLVIICSIYNLLTNLNVIKVNNEKLNKGFNVTNIVLASLVAIFAIVAISCTAGYLNNGLDMSIATTATESLAQMGMTVTPEYVLQNLMTNYNANIGWANITNLVLSIVLVCPVVLSFVFDRKDR